MLKKTENHAGNLRDRAEKILNKTSGKTREDLLGLISELEAYQVQLDLQNQELPQVQGELEASRNEYYDLYESDPAGFLAVTSKGLLARVNRAADEMLSGGGLFIGRAFLTRIHSKDQHIYLSCLKKAADTRGRHSCEVRLKRRNKSLLYVRIEAGAHFNAKGELIEWRLSLFDIARQKAAEEALTNEALSIANERTRAILESISDGFMAVGPEWRITYFNETGARMIGMRRKDLIGGYLWDLFPHATSSKFYTEYHRALETNLPVHFEEFYPEPLNRWIECHGYPSPEGLSVYFRDITERRRAEANQALLTDILRVLNHGGELHSIAAEVLRLIRERTGFDAVGLRLQKGEDHPYFEHDGFPEDFVQAENSLCARGADGAVILDAGGRAVLECTCGVVLSGSSNPGLSCFTPNGSFWSNASSELLALPLEEDPRRNPRNRCIHSGYQSVGLFPVRAGKDIVGILQLNDRREGRFTPDFLTFCESLAQNIGLALQRTAAEEALRESADRLKLAQQIAHLGSWELDLIKNRLIWSDEVYRIFGLQPEEFGATYQDFLAHVHPDDRSAVDTAYARSLRENLDAYEIEHRVIRESTGEIRFVHEKCEHFRDASGRVVRSGGMVLDITERRQVEEALRESEEKFRSAFTNAAIGFALIKPDGRFVHANPAYCTITGYELEDLQTFAFTRLVHPDDLKENMRLVERMMAGLIPDFVIENRYLRKDGGVTWVRKSVSLVRNAKSTPQWIITLIEDITVRKRAEQALCQLNETLEQQVAERTQLAETRAKQLQGLVFELSVAEQRERQRLAEILHDDLQQLLGAAKFHCEALSAGLGTEKKQIVRTIMDIIVQSIQVSRSLTAELSPQVLQLGSLSAALEWLARWMQENHCLTVELQIDPSMDPQRKDVTLLLFRSIRELLFNVVKHSGVKAARIEMSRDGENRLLLAVVDQGCGFDPNACLEEPRAGGGFGLFSIRERLMLLGGELKVESSPGQGACFALVVPLDITKKTRGAGRKSNLSVNPS